VLKWRIDAVSENVLAPSIDQARVARNTLFLSDDRASKVILPVIDAIRGA
jgi:hypothetical protein